jgi:hypothetical protein
MSHALLLTAHDSLSEGTHHKKDLRIAQTAFHKFVRPKNPLAALFPELLFQVVRCLTFQQCRCPLAPAEKIGTSLAYFLLPLSISQ